MVSGASTSSAVENTVDGVGRLRYWLLLGGNRLVLTAGIVVAVVLVVWGLIRVGVLDVGPGSATSSLFGSGLTSGVATLLTIALSINQLILSRVFGSPGALADRLEGTRDLRGTVERLAGEPSSPNDPAAFLRLIARSIQERAHALETALAEANTDPAAEVTGAARTLAEYGEKIDSELEDHSRIVDVLNVILGTEYAENLAAVHHLRNAYGDALPEDARSELDALDELLESIAITRQFLKTLSLQQDFGRLSRFVIYSGLAAFVTAISLTLIYRTNSVTVAPPLRPVLISLGLGVIVAPFATFIAYMLRAATIAHRTVSVGPFIPPTEQSDTERDGETR